MTAMVEKLAPADVLLADGSIAVVRPLRAADGPALHELHERVSDDAIRLRFFTAARHAAHAYVDHVLGRRRDTSRSSPSSTVGWSGSPPPSRWTPTRCEVAFLVADDARGLGVGTLLLEHLAALALVARHHAVRGRRA